MTGKWNERQADSAKVQRLQVFAGAQSRGCICRNQALPDMLCRLCDAVFPEVADTHVFVLMTKGQIIVCRMKINLFEFSDPARMVQMAVRQKNRVRLSEGKVTCGILQKRTKTSVAKSGINQNTAVVTLDVIGKDVAGHPDPDDMGMDLFHIEKVTVIGLIRVFGVHKNHNPFLISFYHVGRSLFFQAEKRQVSFSR